MAPVPTVVSEHADNDLGDVARPLQLALSRWFPASTHPGGFAWEVATQQLPPTVAVARRSDEVVGWAAFTPDDARVECDIADPATTEILIEWLLGKAGDGPATVGVPRDHAHLRRQLTDRGFADNGLPLPGVSHPARDVEAQPPPGYAIRPMHQGEDAARVDVHRRAWKPAHLPFTDEASAAGIDPAAESRLDATRFTAMQASWLYDRDLDVVIEAPDGSLAGCCTVWLDPYSGWAELEPLGIVPEHRRRGLAQTLALDVCRRVADRGGRHVFINSAPLPYYRAPWDAYLKAGFTAMDRGTRMSRPAASN